MTILEGCGLSKVIWRILYTFYPKNAVYKITINYSSCTKECKNKGGCKYEDKTKIKVLLVLLSG